MLGHFCPGTEYAILKFENIGTDNRNNVIIPVDVITNGFVNSLNMLWEWKWDASSEPADMRLQRYFGLALVNKYYNISWPTNVPKSMRFALTED
jgi:hypothetical protein